MAKGKTNLKGEKRMNSVSQDGKFGVNVWWTVPETVVDGERAQAAMANRGFKKEDMPMPSRRAEFSRGVYSLQNQRGKLNRTKVEPVADTPDHVAFGILECAQSGAEEAEYTQKTKAVMDKASGAVRAEGKLAAEVLKSVDAFTGKVTDEDVRYFLRRVIGKCYGVAKRPSGGIYFVPAKYSHLMESAQGAMADLGTGVRIYVERVMDGKEERSNVWEAVEADVMAQIDETISAVGRIEKRANSVRGQQTKLDELSELVDVYKGLLGEEAKFEAVAERIEEAVKVVAEKMQKLQQGTSASIAQAAEQAVKAARSDKEAEEASERSGDDRITVVDAAVAVLTKAGKAMASREVYEEAVKEGWYVSDAKDPFTSFMSVMSKAVAKGDKRLVRVGQSFWSLAA